jgi:hypothetical protein
MATTALAPPGQPSTGPAAHSRLAHKRNWRNGVWERWRPCAGVRTFFTINQGHALRARQVRPCPADRRAKMRKSPGRTARAGVTSTGRSRGEQGDAPTPGGSLPLPRPGGWEAPGRGAAAARQAPLLPAGGTRSNARPRMTAPARPGRAVLPAPGILPPRKDHQQGRCGLRPPRRLLRKRTPLPDDLARQNPAPAGRTELSRLASSANAERNLRTIMLADVLSCDYSNCLERISWINVPLLESESTDQDWVPLQAG